VIVDSGGERPVDEGVSVLPTWLPRRWMQPQPLVAAFVTNAAVGAAVPPPVVARRFRRALDAA